MSYYCKFILMNNNTFLGIAFLFAGTLLTGATAMAPVYAEGDDDKRYDDDNKKYDKGGDGKKQKVEDDSSAAIADCDENEVERAGFDCVAVAEEESGGGGGGGHPHPSKQKKLY